MARIKIIEGNEGPKHDPYAWSEIIFTKTNGDEIVYRYSGLGYTRLYVNGGMVMEALGDNESDIMWEFEKLTGMTVMKAESIYYDRIYIEDPMGSPSQYI